MDNLKDKEYNNEDVIYCEKCLSLAIRLDSNIEYCHSCGSIETKSTNISSWEKIYEERYKEKYVEKTFNYVSNPRLLMLLEESKNKAKK